MSEDGGQRTDGALLSVLCRPSSVVRFEHPVALQIDYLLGLRDCKRDRVLFAVMGVGPDEAVLLHAVRGILLDNACSLIDAPRFVRSGANAIALVFDWWTGLGSLLVAGACARKLSPPRFELGKHCSRPPGVWLGVDFAETAGEASIQNGTRKGVSAFLRGARPSWAPGRGTVLSPLWRSTTAML